MVTLDGNLSAPSASKVCTISHRRCWLAQVAAASTRTEPFEAVRGPDASGKAMPDPSPRIANRPILSVVVPVFNEEEVIETFHSRLSPVMRALGEPWEVVYVNDGSRDRSLAILLALHARFPEEVALVNLSRNFGKEIATTAGLDHARGDSAVMVIDADLQDPPEVIPELVAGWREGFDVV